MNPKKLILNMTKLDGYNSIKKETKTDSKYSENSIEVFDISMNGDQIEENFLESVNQPYQKFQCDHCNYTTNYKQNLSKHVKSIHEGVKYPCNICDYQFTESGNLEKHKRSKHSTKNGMNFL